jgi:hypothetical protein
MILIRILALAVLLPAFASVRADIPPSINYQGRLLDAGGQPVNATVPIAVALFNAETGGTQVFTQHVGNVTVQNGIYSFAWGTTNLATALTNAECWLQVHVNGTTLAPRQRLVSVPYAISAASAATAEGLRLAPAAASSFTNAAAPIGTLRLSSDGTIYANTNGTISGWVVVGGGRQTSYGELIVVPSSIVISNAVGETYATTFTTTNSGIAALDYTISVGYESGSGWLSANPMSKVLAVGAEFAHNLEISASTLSPGIYDGTLTFVGNQFNGPQTLTVRQHVLTTSPSSFSHSTSDDFSAGVFVNTEDIGSGAAPRVRLSYNMPAGPYGFGSGKDGSLTVSANQTYDESFLPMGYARLNSGASGGSSISITDLNGGWRIQNGDLILLHQTRGATAGQWEIRRVVSGAPVGPGGTTTFHLDRPLAHSYSTSGGNVAQLLRMLEFSNVTINSGAQLFPVAWNGSWGGLLAFFANGTVNIAGHINAQGRGYRGGHSGTSPGGGQTRSGYSGESHGSDINAAGGGIGGSCGGCVSPATTAMQSGGGGGRASRGEDGASGGGGGGHGTAGGAGGWKYNHNPHYPGGDGGAVSGNPSLSTLTFGGGGGGSGGWHDAYSWNVTYGGNGGGAVMILGRTINVSGFINALGNNGTSEMNARGGTGGGAGGAIYLQCISSSLGVNLLQALGGAGGSGRANHQAGGGGAGGVGRIAIHHGAGTHSGSTAPAAHVEPIPFHTTGYYRSPPIPTTHAKAYGTISWTATGGTSTRLRTRSASTSVGLDSAAWSAWLTQPAGSQVVSSPNAWFQYEVELNGTAGNPAELNAVNFSYTKWDI